MGATDLPNHDENSALAPPSWKEERPLSCPKCTVFSILHSDCGKILTNASLSRKTTEIFLHNSTKIFAYLRSVYSLFFDTHSPTLQIPPHRIFLNKSTKLFAHILSVYPLFLGPTLQIPPPLNWILPSVRMGHALLSSFLQTAERSILVFLEYSYVTSNLRHTIFEFQTLYHTNLSANTNNFVKMIIEIASSYFIDWTKLYVLLCFEMKFL